MRILFIGGTGNISAACARLCIARGMDVTLLNRGLRVPALPGARTLRADIQDARAVARALGSERFDAVANFIAYKAADVERDIALFAGRTPQYVFISSAAAYQKPLGHPTVTESTPLKNPFWDYAQHKIACEDRLLAAYRERDFPAVIVRPSHTYATIWPVVVGPRTDFTIIDHVRRGGTLVVHGDGTSLWTLTHSDDFAQAFVGLLGNPATIGHAFHITSDESLSWRQIAGAICEAAGVEPRVVAIPAAFIVRHDASLRGTLLGDKIFSPVFDNTKIKRFVPGFTATIPFHEGIRRTLAWFEEDPARRNVDAEAQRALETMVAAWASAGGGQV